MAHLQQRTPAWHLARQGKLTASTLGAALGQVSYISRVSAFRRAVGTEKFEGNIACEWGTKNEANGITDYQTLTGNNVVATGLHVSPDHPWLAGSPDGFVGERGMIEVKCPFYFRKDGSGRLHKEVPPHYYMQMNALMEICSRDWCDYVCWAPEGMVVYRVKRDPVLFDFLLSFYSQFHSAVEARMDKPPPLSTGQKFIIQGRIGSSMEDKIDYEFWSRVDPSFPPPSSDLMDVDEYEKEPIYEDTLLPPPAKRVCVS